MQYIPAYALASTAASCQPPDSRLGADHGPPPGLCIYQEQYMEIAKELAGFAPAKADDLRKAIGNRSTR